MTRDEVIEIIDEMLKAPKYLSKTDLAWIKKIDSTVGSFSKLSFTPRQFNVIKDIYKRYTAKKTKRKEKNNSTKKHNKAPNLLRKYYNFYRDLETGKRKPETPAQEHFVAVCKGLMPPASEHERAYLKLLEKRKKLKACITEGKPA